MKWSNPALAAIAALLINLSAHAQEVEDVQPLTLQTTEEVSILTAAQTEIEPVATPVEEVKTLPSFLNQRQQELLQLAYSIGKKDGLKQPELLQGLLMQETNGGIDATYKAALNRCYGIFQIKIGAARHVLREFPDLIAKFNVNQTNKGITQQLINDDAFNTAVASKYVLILKTYGYDTIKQLALAYNQGMAGAKKFNPQTHRYSVGVAKHIEKLSQ